MSKDTTKILGVFDRDAIPEGAKPLDDFKLEKYLGKWYDISHMHFDNEGPESTNVVVQYSMRSDGMVKVHNSAYLEDKQQWYSRVGKAKFRGEPNVAALAVTFDDIKWSGYNVIAQDDDYKYALVYGRKLDFMWILSREKTMPQDIKQKYLDMATENGYDVTKLVDTVHDRDDF